MTGSNFLLVHGAFHGSWCWQRVVSRLEALGHRAASVDLSQPSDATASAESLMSTWVNDIVSLAERFQGPVVLVGHSRSGLVISQAAERVPERITRLVYCAAMLIDSGETMADARARLGGATTAPVRFQRDAAGTSLLAEPGSAAEFIYPGSLPEDRAWATERLTLEAKAGFQITPRLTAERYGSVPRAAIECLQDAVLPIDLQRGMRRSQPCDVVVTLDCDHAPYLSDPDGLSAALDGIARMPRTPLASPYPTRHDD